MKNKSLIILYSILCFLIIFMCYLFQLYTSMHIKNAVTYSFFYIFFPILPIFICLIIFVINFLLPNKKATLIHHYLDEHIIPSIDLSDLKKQTSTDKFHKYLLIERLLTYISILLAVFLIYSLLFNVSQVRYDFNTHQWKSFQSINIFIYVIAAIFIYFFESIVIAIHHYRKFNQTVLQDSVSYLYLIYLLSGYQRGKPNSLNLIDIMNVGAALGNLGYFQEGYDYLHFLDCHKMIKKPTLLQMYHYHCFIYASHLNLDATYHKTQLLHIIESHPRIQKSKATQTILLRITMEELFQQEKWQEFLDFIQSHQNELQHEMIKPIFQYQLYVVYCHLHLDKQSQAIKEQWKDHHLFKNYQNN